MPVNAAVYRVPCAECSCSVLGDLAQCLLLWASAFFAGSACACGSGRVLVLAALGAVYRVLGACAGCSGPVFWAQCQCLLLSASACARCCGRVPVLGVLAQCIRGASIDRFNWEGSVKTKFLLILIAVVLLFTACPKGSVSFVKVYADKPGLEPSDLYTVQVKNTPAFTEKLKTAVDIEALPAWFTGTPYTSVQQEVHIVDFSCEGSIPVSIEVANPFESVRIKPAGRNIHPKIQGKRFTFVLNGPDKLYIEVDSLPPILFFANPLETDVPSPDAAAPNVRYFGPGEHHPGMMTLKDNETLYLADGAVVYGGIRGEGLSNIRVFGRGILDGAHMGGRMVLLEDCKNVTFEGIMIRKQAGGWTNTLVNCEDVLYEGVKVVSFGPGGDGINPLGSRNFTINNCFMRCTDDCIAIKSPNEGNVVRNIRVTNNTMAGYAFSDGVTIGFETNGPSVSDVVVRNCDVLIARGGSRVDGHSAFSIICDGPAEIYDILYEDIRAEANVLKLFELQVTHGEHYGINPPGHIRDIHLKNISWASERPIILRGFDSEHWVKNVTFENCRVMGEPLTEVREDLFQVNEFVEGVWFR